MGWGRERFFIFYCIKHLSPVPDQIFAKEKKRQPRGKAPFKASHIHRCVACGGSHCGSASPPLGVGAETCLRWVSHPIQLPQIPMIHQYLGISPFPYPGRWGEAAPSQPPPWVLGGEKPAQPGRGQSNIALKPHLEAFPRGEFGRIWEQCWGHVGCPYPATRALPAWEKATKGCRWRAGRAMLSLGGFA